jgi:uncharacterized membrane protein YhaH (DUF805 family)
MNNETLVAYIATERARGVTDDAIKGALLAQGWKEEDVASALGGEAIVAQPAAPRAFSFGNLFKGRVSHGFYIDANFRTAILITLFIFIFISLKLEINTAEIILFYALWLVLIILSLSVTIRRLHDLNSSGWLYFLGFVPLVNIFLLIVLFLIKGTPGENKYGLPPVKRKFIHTLLNL